MCYELMHSQEMLMKLFLNMWSENTHLNLLPHLNFDWTSIWYYSMLWIVSQHWCKKWLGSWLNQWCPSFSIELNWINRWFTRQQGVNSLWPSDVIWRHRSGSTLAQVMACCLTAPSHYLNQCWLIISKIQLHSSDCNFTRYTSVISD